MELYLPLYIPCQILMSLLKIIEVNYIILFIYAIETCGTPFSLQIEISQLMAHLQVLSVLNYVTPL